MDHQSMNAEPRLTLAEDATDDTPAPTLSARMAAIRAGGVALVSLITDALGMGNDTEKRLARLEASNEHDLSSEAQEAVNAATRDVDWENLAEQAMENSGVDYIVESRVEQAVEEIDWEEHSKEAVAELAQEPALLACVEREVVRRVDERLSRMRIVSTIVIDD
jgi:hypothetical protein